MIIVALIALPCIVIAGLFAINTKVHLAFLGVFSLATASIVLFAKDLSATIYDAFEFCYNRTIQIVVDEGYDNYASMMTEDITDKLSDVLLMDGYFYTVLIVLSIVFSVIFTVAMMKRSMLWLCTIPCFIVMTPSLYFGAVPSGPAFAVFLSGILGCYIESLSYSSLRKIKQKKSKDKKDKKSKKVNVFLRSSAVGGLSNAIVVLVVSLTVSVFVYSSDLLRLDDLRKVIDDVAMHIMNVLFYEQYETAEGAVGGLIEGDTLDLDVPEFRQLPIMDVSTRTNTSVYLRGWIGESLDDDGWKVVNEEDTKNFNSAVSENYDPYIQFYNFMTLMSTNELSNAESEKDTKNLGFVYDTVDIKAHFSKSKMAFVPISGIDGKINGDYKGITELGDTVYFFDGDRPKSNKYSVNSALQSFSSSNFYVAIKQKQKNYLAFASGISMNKQNPTEVEQFIINERKYSKYVREKYMDVPEDTAALRSLAQSVTSKYTHDFDKALAIERHLKSEYEYSLTENAIGNTSVDKIKYVLQEGKTGYCTHYASAMTIMLRQLNIPARYVVGYHSKTQTDTGAQKYTRKLVDNNYHAWVEAYIDGIGWLTFDPTPGYGNNAPIRDYDYLDKETPQDGSDDGAQSPQQPQEQPVKPPTVHEVIENVPDAAPKDNLGFLKYVIWALVIIFVISIIVFTVVLVIRTINVRYDKMVESMKKMDGTDMTRVIYPKILLLLSGYKYTVLPGEIVSDFAKRVDGNLHFKTKLFSVIYHLEMAQFSENKIDDSSAEKVFSYYEQLSHIALQRFNIFKRLYFKIKLSKK